MNLDKIVVRRGGNTITWEASSYLYGPSSYSNTRTAAKIKSIEVTGIAYASTCTACPAGSFSKSGASKCEWCPDDFYAPNEGMSECLPCNISTHFSKAGATKCIERPACQESDYFVTHTPCDNNGQTQLMYKWVDPKVCRDGYSESIKLPPSGRPEKCPPCNPGMASTNMTDHRCVVCPRGHYSDGSHPCIKCPPVTEAVYNIDLQFWPNSDSLPHFVTLDCVSDAPGYCVDSGWEFLSNFIGTNLHNNPTAVPQLTIHTIGFRGSESVVTGGEMSIVGHVRFVFETECEHKCEFRFLVQEDTEDAVEVLSWTGSQPKQESSYLVKSTAPAKFIWTFRKVGKDQIKHKMGSFGHFPQTSLVHDSTSRVNIHSINITNTVNGGASYCRGCLTKAKISNQEIARCESCPKGHYVDTNTRECVPCPQNTRLNENYPIGLNSCVACGPGTISKPGSIHCYSDCTFSDDNGRIYNFTRLGSAVHNISGYKLFSSVGHPYYHYFSLNLCGDDALAQCGHNKVHQTGKQLQLLTHSQREVRSHVCRSTVMPLSSGETLDVEPVSLGDQLLAVVTSEESSNLSAMSVIGDIRKGNESILNFFFKGIGATALCPKGRSAVVALHCDVTKGGQGELTLPLHCPDGTCDGCTYGFVWHTQVACPLCRDSDYEKLEGVCKDNKSEIMYLQKEPRECIGGVTRPRKVKVDCVEQRMVVVTVVEHKPVASLLDYKGYIGIALGVAVILVLVLIFLYFKNRRLEYKYQQLKQSAKDGDELPAPETCVQESEDEDEVVYRKGIKTERKLLKKLKGITGKGKDIEMEEMDFQTVQLGSTFENA
ncbi:endosome/lysosome-associated apoptosis and autophagy regulator family member 2-like isoform X2 [Corticium candelabrum]|uniref:endosome/lysosome-associated apoptosis and autophagy regulator family member 2-like isoform X2 n=1 Tax=Corticium candelabrum TaxID=121492 RepID=UPI002E272BE2|nr:endosome/lysosome-associated apoptosis and autophagy regulator family member 2-like isoform X2 [Corticium candelabrum]